MMKFNDKKKQQWIARIIVVLVVLAMVGTLFASMASGLH